MASSASPHDGFSDTPLDTSKASPTAGGSALSHAGGHACSAVWSPKQGRCVREPSFATRRQRAASVEDGTHSRNLPQQAPAYPPGTAHAAGHWPGRSGIAGSPVSRGAKLSAAGMGLAPIPWRQAKRAAP